MEPWKKRLIYLALYTEGTQIFKGTLYNDVTVQFSQETGFGRLEANSIFYA